MSTTTTDPIADMLSRIRNAIAVGKCEVSLPHSKIKESLANLLRENDFIDKVSVEKATIGKTLRIFINDPDENSRITEIVRLSKPGRRSYSSATKIPTIMQGRGIVIVSTSRGIMTGTKAKSEHVGGELLCKVY